MPISITPVNGTITRDYESPFVGPINEQASLKLALAGFTAREIDAKGYLKPGIPVAQDGTLVGGTDKIYGVTIEEVKVAANNDAGTIAAMVPMEIAVALSGSINRAVAEDMLGAAYNAGEVAAFGTSRFTLIF